MTSKTTSVDSLPYPVSIVITNYNQAKFVGKAIESAISQTYKNREIIVVDDGSNDNSVAVITEVKNKYPNEKINIYSKSNGGTASARNLGVAKSTGQFIAFLDADDVYYPDKVAISVGKMTELPGIGVAYSDYDILNLESGNRRREFKHPFNFNYLLQACIVSTNSVVLREVFDTVGMFDESIRGMEDYQFWLRTAMRYAFCHIPFSLFSYTEHKGQKTKYIDTKAWAAEEQKMKTEFIRKYMGITIPNDQ